MASQSQATLQEDRKTHASQRQTLICSQSAQQVPSHPAQPQTAAVGQRCLIGEVSDESWPWVVQDEEAPDPPTGLRKAAVSTVGQERSQEADET